VIAPRAAGELPEFGEYYRTLVGCAFSEQTVVDVLSPPGPPSHGIRAASADTPWYLRDLPDCRRHRDQRRVIGEPLAEGFTRARLVTPNRVPLLSG